MKITCPKCFSAYRVDLPDPSEAGIDVQCGKCLYIFQFSPDIKKPAPPRIQKDASVKTQDSILPEDRLSEPILPPQKDEDQEVSGSKKQAPFPSDKDRETSEEREPDPLSDNLEPIEIIVENETPDDSLEKEALDNIWNQAVEEGARTKGKSKEKSSTPPIKPLVVGSVDEKTPKETPLPPLPSAEKSTPLPSLEDRQREIDQIIDDHQTKQEESGEKPSVEESQPALTQKDSQQEKSQEEIDLEEQVTIDQEEAMPSWEEAFAHQSEVEAGWEKAEEQNRIQEEQQLAEALGKKALPTDPAPEETATTVPQESEQSLIDEVFAEAKDSQESPKETTKTPQLKSEAGPKQEEINQIFAEAEAHQETTQEEVDLNEEVVIDADETIPSWEDAFAHQTKVESGWKKAKEQDQIQEEQQLSEALGETDIPPAQETPAPLTADAGTTAEEEHEPTWTDAFADQSKTETTWKKPEEQEGSSEVTAASEEKEAIPDPDIPGDIDLTADLVDMDMKQLVEQAFKEESEQTGEAPISEEVETPILEEAAPEPELTLELEAETPAVEQTPPVSLDEEEISQTIDHYASYLDPPATPEMETVPELALESADADTTPEPEMEPIPEMTLESAEEEPAPEPVESVAQEGEPEIELELEEEPEPIWTDAFADPSEIEEAKEEPVPEPEETVAQEGEPEVELEPEMESILETAEIPAEAGVTITESLEIEPEPELTMESHEATALSEEQPPISQESSVGEEGEELWADLLPEHKEEEQLVHDEETPIAAVDEEEEPFGGSDFWDQVLEKDSQESQTAETEAEPQPVSPASMAQGTANREAMTDEELWQQAFPGEEELEPGASKHFDEEEENSQPDIPPLVIGANVNLNEEPEDSPEYNEAAYADYDDDDDEFEFQRRKRNLGPFTIPHGRRGDLVIGGAMLVFLLLAGSVYFTLQTFAPGELTEIQSAQTDVPEGLSPREVPLDELVGDLTQPKPEKPEKTPIVDAPGEKGEAILSDPAKILEASPEEKGILKDLAESEILKDTGKSQTAKVDQSALQALTGHSITMSTIMPVAYNPTDIRVLSFSVEIQLSNAQSAKMVRESMPVYEEIMNQAVEDVLRRKFYNDILYVKEKLQKRLQTAMNKSIKNGHVRKAKFTDFAIQ
jgi:predicted Zn finger-like uncharacterized protein